MKFETHQIKDMKIAELIAEGVAIKNIEDGMDLVGNIYFQGCDLVIVHEESITPDFFDLKNGMAGEILQKFSNYRVRLVIVGDFSKYTSKSMNDFIYESNKGKQVNFVATREEAMRSLINND